MVALYKILFFLGWILGEAVNHHFTTARVSACRWSRLEEGRKKTADAISLWIIVVNGDWCVFILLCSM